MKGGKQMAGKLIMVTGGARSGKSEFAEQYVLHYAPKCDYIATAEVLDQEMAERVRLHRQRRNDGRWVNHEAPYEAYKTFASLGEETGAVLFDCLTIYMANLFYGKNAPDPDKVDFCTAVNMSMAKSTSCWRQLGNAAKSWSSSPTRWAAALCPITKWPANTVIWPVG